MNNGLYYRTHKILQMDRENRKVEKEHPDRHVIHGMHRILNNDTADVTDIANEFRVENTNIMSLFGEFIAVLAGILGMFYVIDYFGRLK